MYDYNYSENIPIVQVNNNRKVGTRPSKYIQSGNNVASSYLYPDISLHNPAMGGAMLSRRGGKRGLFKKMAEGVGSAVGSVATGVAGSLAKDYITSALSNPAELEADALLGAEGAEVTAEAVGEGRRKRGRPRKTGGKILGKIVKSVGKVAVPVVSKTASNYLDKVIGEIMKSGAVEQLGAGYSGGKRTFTKMVKSVVKHPVTKAISKEVYDVIVPIIKDMSKKMLKEFIDSQMEGGKFGMKPINVKTFTKAMSGFQDPAVQDTVNYSKNALDIQLPDLGGAMSGAGSCGGATTGGAISGAGKSKKGSRQVIVSKIMKERGVSLPVASSIVKREGLY